MTTFNMIQPTNKQLRAEKHGLFASDILEMSDFNDKLR